MCKTLNTAALSFCESPVVSRKLQENNEGSDSSLVVESAGSSLVAAKTLAATFEPNHQTRKGRTLVLCRLRPRRLLLRPGDDRSPRQRRSAKSRHPLPRRQRGGPAQRLEPASFPSRVSVETSKSPDGSLLCLRLRRHPRHQISTHSGKPEIGDSNVYSTRQAAH